MCGGGRAARKVRVVRGARAGAGVPGRGRAWTGLHQEGAGRGPLSGGGSGGPDAARSGRSDPLPAGPGSPRGVPARPRRRRTPPGRPRTGPAAGRVGPVRGGAQAAKSRGRAAAPASVGDHRGQVRPSPEGSVMHRCASSSVIGPCAPLGVLPLGGATPLREKAVEQNRTSLVSGFRPFRTVRDPPVGSGRDPVGSGPTQVPTAPSRPGAIARRSMRGRQLPRQRPTQAAVHRAPPLRRPRPGHRWAGPLRPGLTSPS